MLPRGEALPEGEERYPRGKSVNRGGRALPEREERYPRGKSVGLGQRGESGTSMRVCGDLRTDVGRRRFKCAEEGGGRRRRVRRRE